jgi:hypothetical protein
VAPVTILRPDVLQEVERFIRIKSATCGIVGPCRLIARALHDQIVMM